MLTVANNRLRNSVLFSADSAYPLLRSLEILNENSTLERKADIFYKRTIKPHTSITSVDTLAETLSQNSPQKVGAIIS